MAQLSCPPKSAVFLCFFAFCSSVHSSSDCPVADEDVKVRWDSSSQTCVPAVCRGAQLSDIPDASGHLSASLACKMELVDTAGAQRCLKGKRIIMLGDSTMTETMHDLTLLLSGTGSKPEELADIVYNVTRQESDHTMMWIPLQGMVYPHGVQVDFYGSHRNMTVTVPFLDTTIHHRFTGHFDLARNGLGILTFTSPQIQQELNCLLQDPQTLGCGPRPPDVLIINSGMHDMETPIPTFAMAMRELAQRLRTLQDSGIHVLWRGNNFQPKSHGLDIISKHYINEEGLTFVNTAAVMKHFAADLASGCCADAITGTHIGAIAKYHNASARLTVSSMVTQELLRHICSKQTLL